LITSGTDNQRKALIEALIAEIKITAADRIIRGRKFGLSG
jgi:hypothetical protein